MTIASFALSQKIKRLALSIAISMSVPSIAHADPITIFAAASLTSVITEATDKFETETGVKSRTSFASSSALARQIEAGAPADLYLSANIRWMDYLIDRGFINTESQNRKVSNQLVLIAPSHLSINPVTSISLETINNILGADDFFTMGDPDHVPVGIYGKAALEKLSLWQPLRKRIARADNARAALALIQRGETPLGIVYRTDATLAKEVDILYAFENTATPIAYALAMTKQSNHDETKRFFKFLTSDKGLALFEKYGFVIETP